MRFFLIVGADPLLQVQNDLGNALVFVLQLLMVALDLDGGSCAEQDRYLLEDSLLFPVLGRGNHGHVFLQKVEINVLFLYTPIAFPARFFIFVGFFARFGKGQTVLRGGEVHAVLFSKNHCFSMLSLV